MPGVFGPAGMAGARRRGRRRGLVVGAAVGSAAAKRNNKNQPEPAVAEPAPVASGGDDQIAQLKQLADLKDQGILTEEEFSAKKKQILGL